ncbi:MAG: ATP-binding protein [Proteobacteria bacterium]|nr:ATP-binding protein [Pseudomonadota bacterium]MBU1582429.1 ATP-binding protein [Pseudomonadota bacterium]MBU2453773.1 ATP-binding protein [Pseudomonadota bacterium]
MRELVILSGKGGTGKTSITAAFASFTNHMILCDADVDAADLHLLMAPDIQQKTDFQGGNVAVIIPDKCTSCGLCIELCRFDAVKDTFEIDPIDCEGCGVCYDLCPKKAIEFPIKTCGEWYISNTRFGPMVHARLGIAQENSGRLVALVRQEARKIVQKKNMDLILTDGPPGIGCPVIASMGQANAILIVSEPTVSGIHYLARVGQLAAHFKIPAMVCVNKYDLNLDQTQAIKNLAKEKNIFFAGQIPFDKTFTESMIQGKNIIETDETSQVSLAVKTIWKNVMTRPAMNIERLA